MPTSSLTTLLGDLGGTRRRTQRSTHHFLCTPTRPTTKSMASYLHALRAIARAQRLPRLQRSVPRGLGEKRRAAIAYGVLRARNQLAMFLLVYFHFASELLTTVQRSGAVTALPIKQSDLILPEEFGH
eukprot:TRINITY_DN58509_c0_g1_i1.p1 TRINITY_DN58509_c0_g1~~TRINITY_DN58509_c0_g1_i1.p1  ORF type:complete len:128 (-),score=9.13 TRINITY_DN58509_c0_g1_i1:167-550(-)